MQPPEPTLFQAWGKKCPSDLEKKMFVVQAARIGMAGEIVCIRHEVDKTL